MRCVTVQPLRPNRRTIIRDVRDLEAASAVCVVGFEVDPEAPRASCEGDGPLVRLTRLVCGYGGH